jgi:hypothetical protein
LKAKPKFRKAVSKLNYKGFVPEKNDTLASIKAKKIAGKFATLEANGLK